MTAGASRQLERAIRRALLHKEWRESRAAVIAGVAIFLGLPILWTSLYNLFAPRPEVLPGLATVLMIAGGWLYAAVVAAQSVCRDLGRPQGEFLLARPVTPADVIRAKATVGFCLILALVITVALWELVLLSLPGKPLPTDRFWLSRLLGAGLAALLAYWVAFAAAAVTRQTLSGVMIAAVLLVLAAAIPLLTSIPARATAAAAGYIVQAAITYHAHGLGFIDEVIHGAVSMWILAEVLGCRPESYHNIFHHPCSLPTVAAAAIVLTIAVTRFLVTLFVARAEALRRPGVRRILTLFGLFLLLDYAIHQGDVLVLAAFVVVAAAAKVGRALTIRTCRSQCVLALGARSVAWAIGLVMILLFTLAMSEVGGNRAVASTYWYPPTPPIWETKVAAGARHIAATWYDRLWVFDLSETGEILDKRSHAVPVVMEGAVRRSAPVPVLADDDSLFIVYSLWPARRKEDSFSYAGPPRIELRRISPEHGPLQPALELPLPDFIPPDAEPSPYDAAIQDDELCILLQHTSTRVPESASGVGTALLAVYRLDEDGPPTLERSFNLRHGTVFYPRAAGYRFSRGADGRVYAGSLFCPPIDPTEPDGGGQRGLGPAPHEYGYHWVPGQLVVGDSVRLQTHRGELLVLDVPPPVKDKRRPALRQAIVVGQAKASPWAWLFRSYSPLLTYAGPNRAWEVHDNNAICYDLSNPRRPRRIGHVTTYRIRDAVAGPHYLVLDHGPGFSIVKHPD